MVSVTSELLPEPETPVDGKRAELNLGGNVFEVVGASSRNLKATTTWVAPLIGHANHPLTG